MKRTILSSLKAFSMVTLLAGLALVVLPLGGCAQQNEQVRLTGEKDRGADTTYAADVQPTGEPKRVIVTKHGPRRR